MEIYETEEQQLEAIRAWWKKHGSSMLWMVIIVLGVVMGYRYWRHHKYVVQEQASEHYAMMIYALEEGDHVSETSQANILIEKFKKTPYAVLAAFSLAKEAVDNRELETGKSHLQWVLKNATNKEFKQIALTRLVRIFVAEQQFEDALQLLNNNEEADGYYTLQEELKGDVFMQNNQIVQAVEAYKRAWRTAVQPEESRTLLRMKLEAHGVQL